MYSGTPHGILAAVRSPGEERKWRRREFLGGAAAYAAPRKPVEELFDC